MKNTEMIIVKQGVPGQRCPFCNSKEIRYLKKVDGFYCRLCGSEWKITRSSTLEPIVYEDRQYNEE
jgi:transposase-like protein